MPIKIATNSHFCLVPSFHRANHDAATAKRSAQVLPYINPERAAAQNQTVPLGTARRNRCWRRFQETERRSRAEPRIAATSMMVNGKTSNKWKMRHHEI